jgi:T1SS-143 domain-containing protein
MQGALMTSPSTNTSNALNLQENAQDNSTIPANTNTDVVCELVTTEEGSVVIGKPTAGVTQVINAEAGQNYMLNFASSSVKSAEVSGDNLIIKFDNGSTVILENYKQALAGSPASVLTMADGKVVSVDDLIASFEPDLKKDAEEEETEKKVENLIEPSEEELAAAEPASGEEQGVVEQVEEINQAIEEQAADDKAEEMAQKEPEAGDDAARLANIEPAAGDAQGALGNTGFGFESSFDPQGVIPISAVGPINPTALQYNLPEFQDRVLVEENIAPPLPALNPEIEVQNAQVLEDGTVGLVVEVFPENSSSTVTVTITGIPSTWTVSGPGIYDPATGTWTLTSTTGVPFTTGPILTPPADSDADLPGLVVTVTESNSGTGQSGTITSTIDVIVDAVADAPDVDGIDDSGLEGETLDIAIPTALTGEEVNNGVGADDGSEVITSIVIEAVDPSVNLNDFTFANTNGPVTLTGGQLVFADRADLVDLTITPKNSQFSGTVEMKVTINTTENPVSDIDTNTANNNASDTDTFTLSWSPVINPPSVTVNNGIDGVQVKEDGSVNVPVVGSLAAGANANEVLKLTVTGIDLTKLEGGAAGFAASNGSNGEVWSRVAGSPDTDASYTITLAAGTNYSGTFSFTPKAQSDLDLTGLSVQATATDSSVSPAISASSSDDFFVTVDAVADVPSVSATGGTTEEGLPLSVDINGALGVDTDGSENITGYEVRGNAAEMANFNFTVNGAARLPVNGVIALTPAEVDALVVTSKSGTFVGTLNLNAVILTRDVPSDGEFDTADNTNSASAPFNLTWTKDDQPIIAEPEKVTVDESNLNPATSISDKVDVNFGADSAGATIKGNGSFTLPSGLKSNDIPVTVSYNTANNTYTGSAAGNTVFTLVIQNNGNYTFRLVDTLDHPDATNPNEAISMNFGVIATDGDGDSATANITVRVLDDAPIANNDVNSIDANVTDVASGNVISGLNGGAGAADAVSEDDVNTAAPVQNYVASVDGIAVPTTGTVNINGQYGVLTIAADGTYSYKLNANVDDSTEITFNETLDFPYVVEGQAISGTTLNNLGIAANALDAATLNSASVSFVSEGAGYNNTLGLYTVAADGTLQAASIIVKNINAITPGALTNFDVQSGESVAFFIIADGFDTNGGYSGIDLSAGDLTFYFGYGTAAERVAKVSDDGANVSLVFTNSTSGVETVLSGAIYHTTERGSVNNLNADDSVRVVSGLAEGDENTLRIGFEDLPNLGDRDYEDVIFDIKLKTTKVTETFDYVLVDGDGDSDPASLTINVHNLNDDEPVIALPKFDQVDESIMNPGDSVSDKIDVDFGSDSAGSTIKGDGSFNGSVALKSNGQAVVVTYDAATGTYTGKAGINSIFTLLIQNDGNYTFKLLGTLDHPDASDPNDLILLNFGVVVTDGDGDAASTKITINVLDDGPVAQNDDVSFESRKNVFKDDVQGNLLVNDTQGADGGIKIVKLSFGGKVIDVPAEDSVSIMIRDAAWQTNSRPFGYAEVTIDSDGSYRINRGWANSDQDTAFEQARSDADYILDTSKFNVPIHYTIADADGDQSTAIFTVKIKITPLVFDLDGDGVELLGVHDGVLFDMGADGVLDQTGWIGCDDGFLALDKNNDGMINDQSELFGDVLDNGFDILSAYDSDGNGVIDSGDDIWADLMVWQDRNINGLSDSGELYSLSDAGIVSIALDSQETDYGTDGSWVGLESTYTKVDGSVGIIADVWFETKAVDGALQNAIDAFVFGTEESAENTGVMSGQNGVDAAVQMASLEGMTGLTLDQILGNTTVV